ncbi:MAG: hypothetical protein FWC40_06155, partial [Proteobacteria bacterium]|nr:hypothetical protein [Pseudomonadota bacterium]
MKAKIRLFAVSCLMPLCLLGCDRKASNAAATTESLDIVNAASQGRFPSAGSAVDAKDVSKSIRLDVSTYFPIWSDNVAATFDVVITNTTQAFVSARLIPKVVIFDEQQN